MLLQLYRTIITATRSTSTFNKFSSKVSFLGRTIKRGMGSSPDDKSAISQQKLRADNKRNRPQSSDASDDLYEEEVPSPSVSVNSIYKSKRRTKIDLDAEREQRSDEVVHNIDSSQFELSTSLHSDGINDGSYLPTSFGKMRGPSASRSLKFHQANPKCEKGNKSSRSASAKGVNIDEPFDICPSETLDQDFLQPSFYEQIQTECLLEENGQLLRPGMVLLKSYIPLDVQVDIVRRCQKLGLGPGGFYRPGYQDGAKLRLYMMCLGLDWNPQTRAYQEKRQHDGAKPPSIPHEFTSLVRRAVDDSHTLIERHSMTMNVEGILPRMSPDVCIVNFYTSNGRLGLHQDRDETKKSLDRGLPVVSLCLGDSAEFLYGHQRNVNKAEKVVLESGDVLIFGGESRHIFHGVKSIIPNTAPPPLLERAKLRPGRLNLTFRQY
ncbi:2-oxoglutarate-dependent dioxygenase family protein [Abeliophyllum distichum]|uniref:2-oxoglutarate-dependent dioxygenase family protein n=1 Tax=Abeliophyllum distichum TaxID=126358 RepID=A0ABD1VYK4_9LAMI